MKVVDAKGKILGRIATRIAKGLLLGEEIAVVNCVQCKMSGKRHVILDKCKQDQDRGIPAKGPFFRRVPARFVKRSIKRMLPKAGRGVDALKRLKCYNAFPTALEGKDILEIPDAVKDIKSLTVGEICKILGGKW